MKKVISIALVTAMTAMMLTACGGNAQAPAQAEEPAVKEEAVEVENEEVEQATEPVKYSMKYVGLKVYDPVYVALEKGFFGERRWEDER